MTPIIRCYVLRPVSANSSVYTLVYEHLRAVGRAPRSTLRQGVRVVDDVTTAITVGGGNARRALGSPVHLMSVPPRHVVAVAVADCPDMFPNMEQWRRLHRFTQQHPKAWKVELQSLFVSGRDTSQPDGHLLRQLRNSWLPFINDLPTEISHLEHIHYVYYSRLAAVAHASGPAGDPAGT